MGGGNKGLACTKKGLHQGCQTNFQLLGVVTFIQPSEGNCEADVAPGEN